MAEQFGSRPEDIICIIGPSICRKCYEVSEDVAIEFIKEFGRNGIADVYKRQDNVQ